MSDTWQLWMKTFGGHVATVRRFLGLTPADLASAAGVSESVVVRFEGDGCCTSRSST